MAEAQEIARLREEVAQMRQRHDSLRPDVDKLLRSLYGEANGQRGFYRGFFSEFYAYQEETKSEFLKVRDEIRMLRTEVDEVSRTCGELRTEATARKRREEKASRWAFVLVPVILGTAATAILSLAILILQTYAFQP